MTDQILFWLKIAALVLTSTAVCVKFRHVRNFSALAYAGIFCLVMKLAQFWAVFFLVMKPHAPKAVDDLIQSRLDSAFTILCAVAFTVAVYYLGGKPSSGFWNWIKDEDEPDMAGVQPAA